jgi:PAS domain S-box-containing protein
MLGIMRLVRRRTDFDQLNAWFDVGTLAMAVGLLVWEPLLVSSGRSLAGAVVAGAYPVLDIVLLGFAGILVGARRPSQSTLLLLGGAGTLFIADLTYLILQNRSGSSTGGWPDPLFVIGAFLLGAGPWFDTSSDPEDLTARRRPRPVAGTVVVIASLVALPIDFGLTPPDTITTNELAVRTLLRILLLAFVAARLLREATRNDRLFTDLDNASTRLGTVIENTMDAVVFSDAAGHILEWNAAAETLFGYPRADVLGRNVLELFARPENAALARDTMASLGPGDVRDITLHLEPNNAVVAVALQIAAVADAHGKVVGFVSVARDDTRRLLARHALQSFAQLDPEAALEKFAFELRAYVPFDVLSLASVEDDQFEELARVTSAGDGWNRAVVAVDQSALTHGSLDEFGAPGAAESISLPLHDPLTDEVRGILAVGFSTVGGATREHAEALERVTPELSQSVSNMMLYAREKRTAERLQELDDLREGFFALVAHEVRSPLGAIGTAASVLRDHGASMDANAARDLAAGITTGARRLARLTGDLVDASRGGHGTFPCEMSQLDDVGATVEAAAVAAAGTQRDRVRIAVAAGVGVFADGDRIGQVVTNLVTNALKFSRGPVEVCLRQDVDNVLLTVSDHGPGIPASQEHRLFQRFTRLPLGGSTGPRPSGTGLGLFITRELVAAHHGSIRHYPTAHGGATFEVRLPCSAS